MYIYSNLTNFFKVATFTFSKNQNSCEGESDLRVRFSTPWTLVNCLVSTIIVAIVGYLVTDFGIVFIIGSNPDGNPLLWLTLFAPPMVLHILGVICTFLFIWFDHICCCCCDCCRGQQEVVVYDPDKPVASLVWRDGEVIDKQEEESENVETKM